MISIAIDVCLHPVLGVSEDVENVRMRVARFNQSHDIHMHIVCAIMASGSQSSEVVELLCACVSGAVAGAIIAAQTMQEESCHM